MKSLLAVLIVAAAAAPLRAQAVSDTAFFQQLGFLNQGVQADAKAALSSMQTAKAPTKDEALRLVLADLAGSGVPEAFVRAAFEDPAVKFYADIPGKFKPHAPPEEQTYEKYRDALLTPQRVQAGVDFYAAHRGLLTAVERRYGVDAGIIAALVGIETTWGTRTGTYMVFSALYTITLGVPARSAWAAKELAEWLKICRAQSVPVHQPKGSYAGAFGFYQFMPSSYNRFAVDYDGDGRKSWDAWPDALAGVANYLKLAGWRPGGPLGKGSRNYQAIFAYNHSDNYVRVIVDLRAEILKRLPVPAA